MWQSGTLYALTVHVKSDSWWKGKRKVGSLRNETRCERLVGKKSNRESGYSGRNRDLLSTDADCTRCSIFKAKLGEIQWFGPVKKSLVCSLDLKNSIYGENVPSKFGEDDDGKSFTYFIIVSKTSMLFWSEIFIAWSIFTIITLYIGSDHSIREAKRHFIEFLSVRKGKQLPNCKTAGF